MSRETSETAREPMDREEILARLEEIARGDSATAALGALKTLLSMSEPDEAPAEGFDALDELAPRRDRKAS